MDGIVGIQRYQTEKRPDSSMDAGGFNHLPESVVVFVSRRIPAD